ncbi:MAG: glycogen synthase [Gemmatimonadetes bacterium]|nr:glycogen synthase [Gemmatimonadota bacterium]
MSEPSALSMPDGTPVSIVHLAAEYGWLARTGGLAEAVAGLAASQAVKGIPVAVIIPLHRSVRSAATGLERVAGPFHVQVGPRHEEARLWRIPTEPGKARVYCIEHPYFDRAGLYGEGGADYGDNLLRWAFFCRAALECLHRVTRTPCVLHCHDWHTALAPIYLRTYHQHAQFAQGIRSVVSVHNAGFQGHFSPNGMPDIGLPWELYTWEWLEWHDKLNLLKGGLKFADAVTTVSPTHAHELRTPVGGFGLHDVFLWLGDRFSGIVNGLDPKEWDPATDPHITANYSPEDLEGKARCKAALQRSFGLPQRRKIPLFAMTARMTHQKGLELITGEYTLFMLEAQFIFLGTGEPKYEQLLKMWEARWPDRISVHLGFSERLEHRLMAGADIYLMPSLYEPCGLAQLRAERYGAIPLARRVGGLADTIKDGETGFLFDEYSSEDLLRVARHVMDRYHRGAPWEEMMRNAMAQDFSWDRSSGKYLEVYQRILAQPPVVQR